MPATGTVMLVRPLLLVVVFIEVLCVVVMRQGCWRQGCRTMTSEVMTAHLIGSACVLPFRQVDVFSAEPWLGNPLAVVHDADGLTDEQMARFARWTNLSETTFLCAPTDPARDYRVRIWTTGGELPFAGHPTIGSAHAWLEAGGVPRGDVVVQECGAGLVDVRRSPRLGFAAPPLRRSGPVDADLRARIIARARRRRRIGRGHGVDRQRSRLGRRGPRHGPRPCSTWCPTSPPSPTSR